MGTLRFISLSLSLSVVLLGCNGEPKFLVSLGSLNASDYPVERLPKPTMELFFLVDNSPSTIDERAKLITAFDAFAAATYANGSKYEVHIAPMNAVRETGGQLVFNEDAIKDGNTSDPDSLMQIMRDIPTDSNFSREYGVAALGLFAQSVTKESEPGEIVMSHMVVLSDEDSMGVSSSNSPLYFQELYTYKASAQYPRGVVNAPLLCLAQGETFQNYTHIYEIPQSSPMNFANGTKKWNRGKYPRDVLACEVLKRECSSSQDGRLIRIEGYNLGWTKDCVNLPNEPTQWQVVYDHLATSEKGVRNCQPIAEKEIWHAGYRFVNTNAQTTEVEWTGCKSGFSTYDRGKMVHVLTVNDREIIAGPPEVEIKNTLLDRVFEYKSPEFLEEAAVLEYFKARYPTWINVTVVQMPDSQLPEADEVSSNGFLNFKSKLSQSSLFVHSVVADKDGACESVDQNDNRKGLEYIKLSEATGGTVADICAPTYDPILEKIKSLIQQYEKSKAIKLVKPIAADKTVYITHLESGRLLQAGVDYELQSGQFIYLYPGIDTGTVRVEVVEVR